MKLVNTLMSAAALALAAVSFNAAANADHGGMHKGMSMGDHKAMNSQNQVAEAEGTVNGVNAEDKTINISHGPIRDFKWPPMTMDLRLNNPAIATDIKAGDRVRFRLKKLGATQYEIIAIDVL